MKTENYYSAQTYATNLNLVKDKNNLSVSKIKDYIKKSPDILKVLLEYVKEIESLPVAIGDAVYCKDKVVRIVYSLIWITKNGETKVSQAVLTDVEGYKETHLIETLKKLK
jgi:hypothetical protein